jgi:protein-S-isoprenylcysteine O-methyltransferase Ste14
VPESGSVDADRSGVRVFPPLLFLGAGGVAFVIHRFLPLRVVPAAHAAALRIAGAVLVLAAVSLAIWAVATFRRLGTTPNPAGGTTALAFDGPYRFSRNPMYSSLVVLTTGVALAFDTLWPLLFLPAVVWLVRRNVIDPEERYLGAKFGEPYRAYSARVRRWL